MKYTLKNKEIELTEEEFKKQQELDQRNFQDLTTEEKIGRLVRVIKENSNSFNYALNRIVNLEAEVQKLKQHEHNQNGDVVVKINNNSMSGLGMVASQSNLAGKSLLD